MLSVPNVVIWLLAITFGGLTVTGLCLYLTHDAGRRASGRRPSRREREATLERWRINAEAARRRLEARTATLGPVPPGRQSTTLACAGVGHRLCNGRQQIAPGETRPCACHCHRPPAVPARPPAVDEATAARLTQALIEASIRRFYAIAGERQTQALLDAGAATWH